MVRPLLVEWEREKAVRAVNDTKDKDNDTVAAIVGAAVGAMHGEDVLPHRWRTGLCGRTGAADDGRSGTSWTARKHSGVAIAASRASGSTLPVLLALAKRRVGLDRGLPLTLDPGPTYAAACHEGNYSMSLMLSVARTQERSSARGPARHARDDGSAADEGTPLCENWLRGVRSC